MKVHALPMALLAALSACGGATEGRSVTKAEFDAAGLRWPLTKDSGTIGCDAEARWFEVDGVRYGLNGRASEERGYTEIEPIWLIDEKMMGELKVAGVTDGPTVRVSIGDMIDEAGKLCT